MGREEGKQADKKEVVFQWGRQSSILDIGFILNVSLLGP